MNNRPYMPAERARLEKTVKSSRMMAVVFLILAAAGAVPAVLFLLRQDWLGGSILLGLSLIFIIPGAGSLSLFIRSGQDIRDGRAVFKTCRVTDKRIAVLGKAAIVRVPFVKLDNKGTEYGVSQDIYDSLPVGAQCRAVFAPRSGELLSVSADGTAVPDSKNGGGASHG